MHLVSRKHFHVDVCVCVCVCVCVRVCVYSQKSKVRMYVLAIPIAAKNIICAVHYQQDSVLLLKAGVLYGCETFKRILVLSV